jgi:hypothetical protein
MSDVGARDAKRGNRDPVPRRWAPGAAHFTGRATEEKKGDEHQAAAASLEELAQEIDGKRKE